MQPKYAAGSRTALPCPYSIDVILSTMLSFTLPPDPINDHLVPSTSYVPTRRSAPWTSTLLYMLFVVYEYLVFVCACAHAYVRVCGCVSVRACTCSLQYGLVWVCMVSVCVCLQASLYVALLCYPQLCCWQVP